MSMAIGVLVWGLILAGVVGFKLHKAATQVVATRSVAATYLREEVALKRSLAERITSIQEEFVDPQELVSKVRDFLRARDSLKAERGRVTITQAELETIEVRLRELDEINRELEASGLEAKEELRILEAKRSELTEKNQRLKDKIVDSLSKIESVIVEIELSAVMQEQIAKARAELLRTEEQIETLMTQIQVANEQYFTLKKRYDALDIEYAQLFERFAEQQRS